MLRLAPYLAGALALAGCTDFRTLPEPPPQPPAVETPAVSEASRVATRHYASVQQSLLAQGKLRTETAPADAPYSNEDLARNFVAIALFDEYTTEAGRLVDRRSASSLRRWTKPVRLQLHFGDSVSPAIRETDRLAVEAYTRRLRGATAHPIVLANSGGNFHVFIVNEDERMVIGEALAEVYPDITRATIDRVENMPLSDLCLALSNIDQRTGQFVNAIAIIRAEHPALSRQSCLHEEIAQGLGLPNDSPDARPSIFNDDEEFAFLTDHDAELLSLLYNPALSPGMTAAQVRPILSQLLLEPAS